MPIDDGVGIGQMSAFGDRELPADQVPSGDLFTDGMLHLKASIDLQKADRAVDADQELAGPGAHVAGLAQDGLARLVEALGLGVREERRGRLLDELLVAALQ